MWCRVLNGVRIDIMETWKVALGVDVVVVRCENSSRVRQGARLESE